jgi:flagellar protein FlgJ
MPIAPLPLPQTAAPSPPRFDTPKLRETFDQFVGETFYGQMLASMRKTQAKPAYFHGGRAEEIFQGQLDQVLSEQLAKANAGTLSGPMFELFSLQRS